MSEYSTVFDLIADAFGKAGVPCVLVGGFAVNAHHVSRQTLDIDLMIAVDDSARASAALLAAGYRKSADSPVVIRFKGDGNLLLDIDLITIEASTLQKILKQAEEFTIAGCAFKVPSLEHLMAMKFHALKNDLERRGPKDMLDIISLARRNGLDPEGDRFRKLGATYGTPEISGRIQQLLKGS